MTDGDMTNWVAIIGAGISGLCMAIQLKRAGIDSFVVLERAGDMGGVWRDNVYPGAACDLPAHLYSYSFAQSADWTRVYATQPEILGYLRRCADDHGVGPHLRFGREVTQARFDPAARLWRLRTAAGEQYAARVLVAATGQLANPRLPSIPGRESFGGRAFHSARWDPDLDLAGRTVAVIGNGCSAVQLVPQIAGRVGRLHVYQRSPKWIIPKADLGFAPAVRRLFRRWRWLPAAYRGTWFLMAETIAYSPIRGGVFGRLLTATARWHLGRQVADPALRARLRPDYPFGCNRMILSNDYYPALCRDNVELVTDGIARIGPTGIQTVDGVVRPADVIVYATGFESTRFLGSLAVVGPAGPLSAAWQDGAAAHLGITVPGFPNLFVLYGPNTSSANNSVVHMIESQVRYVLGCLDLIGAGGVLEVRAEAFDRYQRKLESRLSGTVWTGGCRSWYKTESGRITNPWPGRAAGYRRATRRPHRADFKAADFKAADSKAADSKAAQPWPAEQAEAR
jgi:cation diffusion facilitator CzcD-associated flavoprotein CzcO